MGSPQSDRLAGSVFEHNPPDEARSNKSPRVNQLKCICDCGCMCCGNTANDNAENTPAPTPIRGRSLTPKHDRTNAAGSPVEARPAPGGIDLSSYSTTSSLNGQESLQTHQIERPTANVAKDLDAPANDSIERWLLEHHIPEHPYCFPDSPAASMLAEASTAAPSLASSGFLPPRVATSDELTTFTWGGFDEPDVHKPKSNAQTCAFTPLWLTHELRYCRNFQHADVSASDPSCPVMIDIDDF